MLWLSRGKNLKFSKIGEENWSKIVFLYGKIPLFDAGAIMHMPYCYHPPTSSLKGEEEDVAYFTTSSKGKDNIFFFFIISSLLKSKFKFLYGKIPQCDTGAMHMPYSYHLLLLLLL